MGGPTPLEWLRPPPPPLQKKKQMINKRDSFL